MSEIVIQLKDWDVSSLLSRRKITSSNSSSGPVTLRGRAGVARWAHNPQVGGSNPPLATKAVNAS